MHFELTFLRAPAIAGAVALLLGACGGGGGYDEPATPAVPAETLNATLTADQEAPATVASGAKGSASLSLDRATRTLSATVSVDGATPTLAHIHVGAAGKAGAVVLPLALSASGASLAATVLSTAQLQSLDAGDLYLNVHSAAHPGGEIRGQIGREVYSARLSGAQETAPVATTAHGSGRLVLNPVTRALSGELEVHGLAATAAHIHAGAVGSNGAVAIALVDHGGHGHFEVPANTVLTPAQVDALRAGGLYFNVHSAANPGGEVRGQIGRTVAIAAASGAQEVPSNVSAASGRGIVSYDPATRRIEGTLTLSGMTATIAHIHMAAAGANGPVIVGLAETAAGSGVWAVPANTVLTAPQAQALLSGGLYFNAHSAAFAGGEVRGQLQP
ncbi:CHRD domain-containing protein [Aquincola sp. S2]|uniref:CHRD domain-containing protein n=1 Tax=Pseudaquabacterium terrae TaxID=2732868 RepID=A0ABX2EDD5_9BURK|nr:CHRD domain-containing protein [Aquabacterium terrae]NRF66163.1 CHRD domain-containing protein [Aquabacterium terrae]